MFHGVSQSQQNERAFTISQYHLSDTDYVVLQTDKKSDKSDVHVYRREGEELIPLCVNEHGEHEENVIPTSERQLRSCKS